jgi:CDP-paratose 2-epimerase
MSRVLVTGGAGFVGTNVAHRLLCEGHRVRVLDDLSRAGVEANLTWLQGQHPEALEVEIADLGAPARAEAAVRGVNAVIHLAAQVAVTTSVVEPRDDARVNVGGTLNLLEAARARPRPPTFLFTSTNKVYGALPDIRLVTDGDRYRPADPQLAARGVDERRPLHFCTPYGCSKGAADQYVLDYAATYGVPSVVFRMSCIYGPHQHGTEDQGWVAHFLIRATQGQTITIYGDGRQVRDILYIDDLTEAMLRACAHIDELAGRAFNIGGGPANAVSVREVLQAIAGLCGLSPRLEHRPWRVGDQRYYVSDATAFSRATGWSPTVAPAAGIAALHRWLLDVPERVAA